MNEQTIIQVNPSSLTNSKEWELVNTEKIEEEKPPALKELPNLVDRPLKIVIPGGDIPEAGVHEIRDFISNTNYKLLAPLVDDDKFEWKWQTKKGNLPKRLGKYFKKHFPRIEVDQSILVQVGNIAQRHTSSKDISEYFFEFTYNVNWEKHQMGQSNDGSCWWGSSGYKAGVYYTESSAMYKFLSEGGLAVKFYPADDKRELHEGIGRLWLMLDPDNEDRACVFNGYWYGQGATLKLARVISTYLGLSYKKVRLSLLPNGGYTPPGRYYVNSGNVYVISTSGVVIGISSSGYIIPRVTPKINCSNCNLLFPEAEASRAEGDKYCSACFELLFTSCTGCYATKRKDQFIITVYTYNKYPKAAAYNYNSLGILVRKKAEEFKDHLTPSQRCKGCLTRATQCVICKNYYTYSGYNNSINKAFKYIDDAYVCKGCIPENIKKCQDCSQPTRFRDAMDDPLCLSCEKVFDNEINIEYQELLDQQFERRELRWARERDERLLRLSTLDRDINKCTCQSCSPKLYPLNEEEPAF